MVADLLHERVRRERHRRTRAAERHLRIIAGGETGTLRGNLERQTTQHVPIQPLLFVLLHRQHDRSFPLLESLAEVLLVHRVNLDRHVVGFAQLEAEVVQIDFLRNQILVFLVRFPANDRLFGELHDLVALDQLGVIVRVGDVGNHPVAEETVDELLGIPDACERGISQSGVTATVHECHMASIIG